MLASGTRFRFLPAYVSNDVDTLARSSLDSPAGSTRRAHGFIQQIGAHLFVSAKPLATVSITIRSCATIIGVIPSLSFCRFAADGLPVVRVVTTRTDNQTLKQVSSATPQLPTAFAVLDQSFCNGSEEILANDCRHGNSSALIFGHIVDRVCSSWLLRTASLCPQNWPFFANSRLAVNRESPVRRILEMPPDRRSIPITLALRRKDPLFLQAATHFADRQAVTPDPLEDLADDTGLFQNDLVTRLAVPLAAIHITVAVGAPLRTLTDPWRAACNFPRRLRSRILRVHTLPPCLAPATADLLPVFAPRGD